MSDERFDRLEDMLATLIDMVDRIEANFGVVQEDISQLKGDVGQLKASVKGLESRLDTIENNQVAMREENEARFTVVDKKLDSLLAEQEFIWEKAVRTEREVGKMKNLLQL